MSEQRQHAVPGNVTVSFGLPVFSGGSGSPPEARIYLDHYCRLRAIAAAAASGDALLLRLALAHQARFGTRPEVSDSEIEDEVPGGSGRVDEYQADDAAAPGTVNVRWGS